MSGEKWASFVEDNPKVFQQGLFDVSTTQKQRIGTIRRLSDGREFVYGQVGAANVSVGVLCQQIAHEANHANCTLSTANVGEYQVTVTLGNALVAANKYAEGYLHINTPIANGGGFYYKIRSHPAAAANATVVVTLYDKIRANLATAASKGTLSAHPAKGFIVHPSPPTGALVGVTLANANTTEYVWLQKQGPCPVLANGTIVAGDRVYTSTAVDGAVSPSSGNAIDMAVEQAVGNVISVDANAHYALIDLNL